MRDNTDIEIRGYLLGRLPAAEQERFEERYFANDELFERVLDAEDTLIAAFTAGTLPQEDHASFEQNLMRSSRQRERVELVRALAARPANVVRAGHQGARHAGRWRAVAVAAAAALVAVAGAWGFREIRLTDDRARERASWQQQVDEHRQAAARTTERNDALAADIARERRARMALEEEAAASQATRLVAAFTLFPGILRDASGPRSLTIPPQATTIRLTLDLEDDGAREYGVSLATMSGRDIMRRDRVSARPSGLARVLDVDVPRTLLAPGTYEITLTALAPGGAPVQDSIYLFAIAPSTSSRER